MGGDAMFLAFVILVLLVAALTMLLAVLLIREYSTWVPPMRFIERAVMVAMGFSVFFLIAIVALLKGVPHLINRDIGHEAWVDTVIQIAAGALGLSAILFNYVSRRFWRKQRSNGSRAG